MSSLPLFLLFFVSLFTYSPLSFAAAIPPATPKLQERGDGGQQTAAQGLASPFASAVAGNQTDREVGVYFCTATFWNAEASDDDACIYNVVSSPSSSSSVETTAAVTVSDPCVRLRSTVATAQGKPLVGWYRNVGSFAPDGGVECVVYDADDCTGASLRITAPGFADLGVVGWARRIVSYACVASDTSASGGSWFGGGQ